MKQLFIVIIMALLFAACGGNQPVEEKADKKGDVNLITLTDAQVKNAGIETGKLKLESVSSILKANGKIDVPPQNMVSVSIPLGGYLKSTELLPGMRIHKGQIIAVMEDQQYIQLQQDYLTSKAQFGFTESEYNRQKELNQTKATSDKIYEQTRATYQTQNILVKSLEQKLRLINLVPEKITPENISRTINIYSPIDGFVSEINVNIGKYVNPSDVLFELVNPADIHLNLNIFEMDLDKLFIGQDLLAYTNSLPDKKYPCTIILISKKLSNDRSAEVHCHFNQYDKNLLPGMFMNAEIEVKNAKAQTLPNDAIVNYENKQFVFISLGNNQFELMEVKTGISERGITELMATEKMTGQSFVVRGAYSLLMKMKNSGDKE